MKSELKLGCTLVIVGIFAIAGLASPSLAEVPNAKPDAPAAGKPTDAARDSLASARPKLCLSRESAKEI